MGEGNQSPPLYAEKQKRDYDAKDWISELHDDILIFILSLLTLEEATRTSVISNRWKTLWVNRPNLHFDCSKRSLKTLVCTMPSETEMLKFKRWVNHAVKSYQGTVVEEFRVCFVLNQTDKFDIDAWVHFAIGKRVKMLELNFFGYGSRLPILRYTFPYMHTDVKYLSSHPLSFSGCNSLTFLRLHAVNVTGESIEDLLSKCPLLEQLFVKLSDSLVDLKVDGPSLKLKVLKIWYCHSAKNIEISAKNLVSFTYIGPNVNLSLKNAPQLVDLHIGHTHYTSPSYVFCQLSNYICQLESLTLDNMCERSIESYRIPVLDNLKHLKFYVDAKDHESFLEFTSLIEACPLLCKFSFEFRYWEPSTVQRKIERVTPRSTLKNLKVIEFIGFVCRTIDVELATYLSENSCKLEKVIFDTRAPFSGCELEYETAKRRAEQFGKNMPRGADLVII